MKLHVSLLLISLGLAGSAHAMGRGDGAGDRLIREQVAHDEKAMFPATGASSVPESDDRVDRKTPTSERIYEYPSGDATPICVNPPR